MTTRIHVSDTGLEVIPPRDVLTQGSDNTLTLEFEFSGAWLECSEINAVFTDSINSATTPVTGCACVIPVEVLQNPWRFVSISLNGTSAGGVITSPFVRIGQVLPSASGGEGGKFVTMAQLMEILQGYVKIEDLGVYVTQEQLQAALETVATQADIDRISADIEQKAEKTTVAALAGTVAAQGAELEDKADKTQLDDYWGKSEIALQTDGDGKKYLANDGEYYEVQGGSGGDKVFIAEYNVTTAQEINAFIDASNEPVAPMQVKRGGSYYTVITAVKQDYDKAIIRTFATLSGEYYVFTYTITGNTWAASSYGIQQKLESGVNIKTINGQSVLGSGDIPIQGGGGDVTRAELDAVHDELQAEIEAQAADIATNIAAIAAQNARIGTNEMNITALQNDKADKTQLDDYETKAHALEIQNALQSEIDGKASAADLTTLSATVSDKADSATVSALETRVGANETDIAALQSDVAGKVAQSDFDALSATVAQKADASALDDYETTAHAEETYATKDSINGVVKSVTASGFTVTPDANGNVNVGGTDVSRTATSGSWGSEIIYTIAQTLPTGASSDTKGSVLTVVKRTENSGATPRIKMTVDGVQLATSADVPDVSNFATLDYVQNTFETSAHAAETYLKKTDASEIKTIKSAKHTVTVENGVADIGGTMVSRDNSQTSTNSYSVVTVKQNLPATSDATGDEGASFVISKAGTLQGVWQNISIDGVNVVTAYELNFRLSNLATKEELNTATTDMATQTWVREYIASLDGTNMQF